MLCDCSVCQKPFLLHDCRVQESSEQQLQLLHPARMGGSAWSLCSPNPLNPLQVPLPTVAAALCTTEMQFLLLTYSRQPSLLPKRENEEFLAFYQLCIKPLNHFVAVDVQGVDLRGSAQVLGWSLFSTFMYQPLIKQSNTPGTGLS